MILLLGLLVALAGVLSAASNWYDNAVIYQIYPRSFLDMDGDGIGDLKGILSKVDYLSSLGIDAVWLSPIYPSPNEDYGYDISNYIDVNSEFGTLVDFDILVKALKDKGIRVILDFVPNHSSTEHEWFKLSESNHPNYTDWYVWKNHKGRDRSGNPIPPNNWLGVINTGSAWKWSEKRQQFYLHNFLEHQADLNYANPKVLNAMNDVLKFWMKRGVSGFRVDAVSWLRESLQYKDETQSSNYDPKHPNNYNNLNHNYTMDLDETFPIVQAWRSAIDHYTDFMDDEARIMFVESYSNMDTLMKYYGTPDKPGATFPFNFIMVFMQKDMNALQWKNIINDYLQDIDHRLSNWVLGNHDQNRVVDRWSEEWVDILHMLMLTLNGTAFTYYGEELGLNDNMVRWDQQKDIQGKVAGIEGFNSRSRDFERGPMPWDDGIMAGFTNSSSSWLPLAPSYWKVSVKAEEDAERSHLKVYKALVGLRKTPTLKFGDCNVATLPGSDDELLFVIRSQKDNPTIITIVNIGDKPAYANLHNVRPGLPDTVRLLVSSINYQDYKTTRFQTDRIKLQPKTGVVVSTDIKNTN